MNKYVFGNILDNLANTYGFEYEIVGHGVFKRYDKQSGEVDIINDVNKIVEYFLEQYRNKEIISGDDFSYTIGKLEYLLRRRKHKILVGMEYLTVYISEIELDIHMRYAQCKYEYGASIQVNDNYAVTSNQIDDILAAL